MNEKKQTQSGEDQSTVSEVSITPASGDTNLMHGTIAYARTEVAFILNGKKTPMEVVVYAGQNGLTAAGLVKQLFQYCNANVLPQTSITIKEKVVDLIGGLIAPGSQGKKSKKNNMMNIGMQFATMAMSYGSNANKIMMDLYGGIIDVEGPDTLVSLIKSELNRPQFHISIVTGQFNMQEIMSVGMQAFQKNQMLNEDEEGEDEDDFEERPLHQRSSQPRRVEITQGPRGFKRK